MGVFVEFIISPSQFYIHICSREASDKLQDMMIEMRCEHAMLIQYYYPLCVYVLREQGTQLLVMVTTGLILDMEMLVPY